MRHPRSGGDDPAVAALARWQAAKRTIGFLMEAALALYEGQTWEDATHTAAEACGEEWPVVRQWLDSNRVFVEAAQAKYHEVVAERGRAQSEWSHADGLIHSREPRIRQINLEIRELRGGGR